MTIAKYGPDSVATYWGTGAWRQAATLPVAKAWWQAIGSRKAFSPITIDQVAKTVAVGRMGAYLGGHQTLEDSDVWLEIGGNQLISLQSLGWVNSNPTARLRAERQRGLRLIVIDPRRTELAAAADLHLQLIPGTDAVLIAAILNRILELKLDRPDFCRRYTRNADRLRSAVGRYSLSVASAICGIPEAEIAQAADIFGTARRGMANGHTGVDMGPHGNLVEHLLYSLNLLCGRFLTEGETYGDTSVVFDAAPRRAEVMPPLRAWERGWRSRHGYGLIPSPHAHAGELPATLLAEEILDEAPDRVRALVTIGGNPAVAIPDKKRIVSALSSLDLHIAIDPWLSETARLADYVIAPAMQFERPDFHTLAGLAYAVYTPALVPRPPGVLEEWQFFWLLGEAMGLDMSLGGTPQSALGGLTFGGVPAGRRQALSGPLPSSDEILDAIADGGHQVSLDEVRRHPHGYLAEPRRRTVLPARESAQGERIDLMPDEVAAELAGVLDDAWYRSERGYRLIVRRARETFNSIGRQIDALRGHGVNPLSMHPDDLGRGRMSPGDAVEVRSDHGFVHGYAPTRPCARGSCP